MAQQARPSRARAQAQAAPLPYPPSQPAQTPNQVVNVNIATGFDMYGEPQRIEGSELLARAIQHGEAETGVTVIRMTPRIDAGGMIAFAGEPLATAARLGIRSGPDRGPWPPPGCAS